MMKKIQFSGSPTAETEHVTRTIVDLFEDQVCSRPQHTALLFHEEKMNYGELNGKANQLAYYLKKIGVGKESLVAVCMERTPEMVIAILAILKAGAAYVPIEPEYPIERIAFVLKDCNAHVLICSEQSKSRLNEITAVNIIVQDVNGGIEGESIHNLDEGPSTSDLAYVIYTSGSTGTPKGVMVEHRNVYAFLQWAMQEFSVDHFSLVYASTSICFDLSVFELFFPLSTGKPLRLVESGLFIANYLKSDTGILLNTVPGVVESMLRQGTDMRSLAMINMAGEPIPLHITQNLDTAHIEARNLYGPTETTVYSTCFHLAKGQPALIGKAVANTFIYILNQQGKKTDAGRTGEIYIGGAGVARGYLNNHSLTNQRFLPDPFQNKIGAKMYRTGDLGRVRVDGNIEYLGRMDDQVKIRGYRIELAEIEYVLEQSPLVQRAIVLAKKDREENRRLVAYIVPEKDFEKAIITSWLREKLPDFMIPALLVPIDHVPVTPNGKTDRRALPDPDDNDFVRQEYRAPDSIAQKHMVAIWKELLNLNWIGINDNFFDLGGSSLMTLEVVSRAKDLGYVLQPMDIYSTPTLSALSAIMETRREEEKGRDHEHSIGKGRSIVCIQKEGSAPPFFAIPGFWLYQKLSFHLKDRPFYGFEPYAYKDLHAVSIDFIEELRSVQPQGPYFLGAFCEHYPVLFEMAHELLRQGETVPVVALFEAYAPEATLSKTSMRYIDRKIKFYSNQLKGLSALNKMKLILSEVNRTVRFRKSKNEAVKTSSAHPQLYPGNVALFKASIRSPLFTDDPQMGWSKYVTGNIETYTIDGDHSGILKEPAVVELADKLDMVLNKYFINLAPAVEKIARAGVVD